MTVNQRGIQRKRTFILKGVMEIPCACRARSPSLLKHIQQFADFYRVMLSVKGDPLFVQRFRQKTEKCFLSYFNQIFPELALESGAPPIDLRFNFIAYAGFGAIVWWLEQEQPCSPEQLAGWLYQFIYDTAVASLKLKHEALPIKNGSAS
jgi:Transcriptional regulator C-terminal region